MRHTSFVDKHQKFSQKRLPLRILISQSTISAYYSIYQSITDKERIHPYHYYSFFSSVRLHFLCIWLNTESSYQFLYSSLIEANLEDVDLEHTWKEWRNGWEQKWQRKLPHKWVLVRSDATGSSSRLGSEGLRLWNWSRRSCLRWLLRLWGRLRRSCISSVCETEKEPLKIMQSDNVWRISLRITWNVGWLLQIGIGHRRHERRLPCRKRKHRWNTHVLRRHLRGWSCCSRCWLRLWSSQHI